MSLIGVGDTNHWTPPTLIENSAKMDGYELVRTASDFIATDPTAAAAVEVVRNAGGFLAKAGGTIALGKLIGPKIDDMLNRFREAQEKGEIPRDFESTDHGAALLQQALNALLEGLDQERADAVKKVFLGLAKNPVQDSLEKVQQMEVMRVASELTAWELAATNALERFRVEASCESLVRDWKIATSESAKEKVRQAAIPHIMNLNGWLLNEFCGGDRSKQESILLSFRSLHAKRIFRYADSNLSEIAKESVYLPHGCFRDFGWKIAVHLYSATDGTAK